MTAPIGHIIRSVWRRLRPAAAVFALPLLLLTAQPAQALGWSDFVKIVDLAHQAQVFPISGAAIDQSKSLFDCLSNAGSNSAVATCIDQAKNSELGKKLQEGNDVPSWFWQLLDLYVAVSHNDFWGIVENVGVVVACAGAQSLAGGVDVCGLLKALEDLANAVVDIGGDIADFLGDVAGWVSGAISDIGEFLGFGGSDFDPVAYWKGTWEPHLAYGAFANLIGDSQALTDFNNFTNQLYHACADPMNQVGLIPNWGTQFCTPWKDRYVKAAGDLAKTLKPKESTLANQLRPFLPSTVYNWISGKWNAQTDGLNPLVTTCLSVYRPSLNQLPQSANKNVAGWLDAIAAHQCSRAVASLQSTANFYKSQYDGLLKDGCKPVAGQAPSVTCPSYTMLDRCKTVFEVYLKKPNAVGQQCRFNAQTADANLAAEIVKNLGKNAQYKPACEVKLLRTVNCHRKKKHESCNKLLSLTKAKYPATQVSCALQYTPDYLAKIALVRQTVAAFNGKPVRIRRQVKVGANVMVAQTTLNHATLVIDPEDPLRTTLKVSLQLPGTFPTPKLEDFSGGQAAAQVLSQNPADCKDLEGDGLEKPAVCFTHKAPVIPMKPLVDVRSKLPGPSPVTKPGQPAMNPANKLSPANRLKQAPVLNKTLTAPQQQQQ